MVLQCSWYEKNIFKISLKLRLELTKSRYIQPHWNAATIEGFISKQECQQLLIQKGPGTFMLRFSDSKLGGISTAYAAQNEDGTVDVKHLEPDTLKILQVNSSFWSIFKVF